MRMKDLIKRGAILLLPMLMAAGGCSKATEPPPFVRIVVLKGSDYERGFQHGQLFSSEIRSFYTRMLTNSLMPAISRERPDIAEVLWTYQDERYAGSRFAEEVMLESAYNLELEMSPAHLDEIQGLADGAGLPYDQMLLLNTFIDSVLGVRSIQKFVNLAQAPRVTVLEIRSASTDDLEGDGVDNDEDGQTDEVDEGILDPYDPLFHAPFVEVPTDAVFRWVLWDPDGVNPESIRLMVEDATYLAGDPALSIRVFGAENDSLELIFTPPAPLPAAAVVTLRVEATDTTLVTAPPPTKSRVMREQAVVVGTTGLGKSTYEIPNRSILDDRFPPYSQGFGVRDGATPDGEIRVGHHFVLFDGNVAHKHNVVFVHVPDDGSIPHVTLGWTGITWGVAGMNAEGLVWTVNSADTLDNPMVKDIYEKTIAGQLISTGIPVGYQGRELLATHSTVAPAEAFIRQSGQTVGWTHMLADSAHAMRVVERDGNMFSEADGGALGYDTETRDANGRRIGSATGDDLYMSAHYLLNMEDLRTSILGFDLMPQRYWSGIWHSSVRSQSFLSELLVRDHGSFDAEQIIETLRHPEVVNTRDSMTAAVFEPESQSFHVGLGVVPATGADFIPLNLTDLIARDAGEVTP
ncbi:MAG: carcinine hydrolase/isopenicillin-N N-acyltransferase family protein [Deltaproteobacteria bacterium]|nr:carcinine hydrolase/isopenicillin-N N-acyltransferase family protein [Deltaproteobacteria bacterium]